LRKTVAYKVYKSRFPLRKLNQKKIFKRRSLRRIPQPRTAGRGKIKQSKRKEAKNDEKDDRDKQYLKDCSVAPGKRSFFERRHLV